MLKGVRMSFSEKPGLPSRLLVGLVSVALAMPAMVPVAFAQSAQQSESAKLSQAQLAALVAPIALYPDSLVAQVLMASTYPLEVAEASNWQKANSQLKGNALNQALQQQNWDASVKSLVSFPPVLNMMGSELSWTQNLGNAVLAQQSDVMNAIQELRAKAQQSGALKSNSQQTVSGGGSAPIVIQPANPQVVYVPTYNPAVVYGGWPYPAYPPYAYYPPGYVAGTALLSFGVGMAVGAALWGGCHWGGGGWGGGNSLTVNNNNFNNFNHNTNNNWRGGNSSGSSNWQADQQRRNANVTGGANREAERNQLRSSLNSEATPQERNQFNRDSNQIRNQASRDQSDGASRQTEERQADMDRDEMNRQRSRDTSNRDPGGFGDTRGARFDGGNHFGGGGRSFGGGGGHFGGGRR
jgi:hypothetical protein